MWNQYNVSLEIRLGTGNSCWVIENIATVGTILLQRKKTSAKKKK